MKTYKPWDAAPPRDAAPPWDAAPLRDGAPLRNAAPVCNAQSNDCFTEFSCVFVYVHAWTFAVHICN